MFSVVSNPAYPHLYDQYKKCLPGNKAEYSRDFIAGGSRVLHLRSFSGSRRTLKGELLFEAFAAVELSTIIFIISESINY